MKCLVNATSMHPFAKRYKIHKKMSGYVSFQTRGTHGQVLAEPLIMFTVTSQKQILSNNAPKA